MAKQLLSKAMQARKEELSNELQKIATIEEQEIINEHYPAIKKKFEGKYFRCRNSYNAKESWWMYIKVVQIKPDDVYDTKGNGVTAHYSGFNFQTDSNGNVTVEIVKWGYVHTVGQKITKKEFDAAWRKTLKNINSIGLKAR